MRFTKFQTDLIFGMKYEQVALNYLLPFDSYKISDCNFKKYDIKTYNIDENKYIKYEVKSDKIAYKTGNICIETKCRGKLSGINCTTAKYYIYFVMHKNLKNYDVYRIKTKKLKKLCENKTTFYGGDSGASEFHLLKIKDIQKYKIN